jgi:hypothetical protein
MKKSKHNLADNNLGRRIERLYHIQKITYTITKAFVNSELGKGLNINTCKLDYIENSANKYDNGTHITIKFICNTSIPIIIEKHKHYKTEI